MSGISVSIKPYGSKAEPTILDGEHPGAGGLSGTRAEQLALTDAAAGIGVQAASHARSLLPGCRGRRETSPGCRPHGLTVGRVEIGF